MRKSMIVFTCTALLLVACKDEKVEDVIEQQEETEVVSISNEEEAEVVENEEGEFDLTEVSFQPYLIETELNKRDVVLMETEGGKITLVGEMFNEFFDQNTVQLAVKYEGDLQHILRTTRPMFRVITDAGEVYERAEKQERVGEDGAIYVEYVFPEVQGASIARIDYKFDEQEGDYEKIILEPTEEKASIPAVYNYTSVLSEPFVVKDSAKTIEFKSITYDYDGKLNVTAVVTYNEDIEFEDAKVYVTQPITKLTEDAWLTDEFFAGIPKEVSFNFDMGVLSQNIPYIKLHLFDTVTDIKLFTGDPSENEIEVLSLKEESLNNMLMFNERKNQITDQLVYPKLNGLVDAQGTAHYAAKAIHLGYNYGIGTVYNFQTVKVTTIDYATLEMTLAVHQEKFTSDIVVSFVSDDFSYENVGDVPVISGTVLKEVTIPANGTPQTVSVDVKDTEQLTIFLKGEIQKDPESWGISVPSKVIYTDSKLKK